MKKFLTTLTLGSLLLTTAGYAQSTQSKVTDAKQVIDTKQTASTADDDAWHFSITPYLWIPGSSVTINTPVTAGGRPTNGTINSNKSWTSVIGKLGSSSLTILSADGRFEVSKGKWGGFVDGYWMYARVKQSDGGTSTLLDDRVTLVHSHNITNTTQTAQVNLALTYLLGTVPLDKSGDYAVGFQVYEGARVNYISNKTEAVATLNSRVVGYTGSVSRTFAEPLLGVKTTWKLGSHFIGMIRGDVGGFGLAENDNVDCDLEAGIGWEFHTNTYLDLGYRARGQWQNHGRNGNIAVSGWYHGPELGITFKF